MYLPVGCRCHKEIGKMSDRKISDIVASYSGPIIAISQFDGPVTIWDLRTNTEVCQFESCFETGGQRE